MLLNETVLLNKNQKKAVIHKSGSLLIIAGAGTGKTTVITEKIKYLLKKGLAVPGSILALTFTEKASFEMQDRVDRAMPYGYFQMSISTFHRFADQVLKLEGNHIGLTQGFKLMSDAESVLFLKENLFLFNLRYFRPLGNPHKFLEAMLHHFSRLRDEDIDPKSYLDWVKKQKNMEKEEKEKYTELGHAYDFYQTLKAKEGFLDFSDLIYYTLKLFRQRKHILDDYRQRFSHIFVDEFQDTNIAQYELIKLLCPPAKNPNLTVVGDDSQAIYKFRGASISNILTFMKDYPKAKQVTLTINYRSTQAILDAAHQLIQNNNPDTLESRLGISKRLVATKKSDGKQDVQFHMAKHADNEATFVAERIRELKKKHEYAYSDFAVLVRSNNASNAFISEFAQQGIPYQFLGPGMLFRQPEVKDLIAYLKVLYNLEDSTSLYRVLSMDIFGLDAKDIHLLLAFAKKTNVSLLQAVEIYLSFKSAEKKPEFQVYEKYIPLLTEETQSKLQTIFDMMYRHLKQVRTESAGQILYYFLEDTTYLAKLVQYKSRKEEKIAMNVSKFFKRLKTYETEHEDATLFSVVDFIEMSMELGESPPVDKDDLNEVDAVHLLTVHSAKGLEFPVVFIVNMNQNKFPTVERRETIPIPTKLIKEILPEGNYHLQEERRLFYVAITRAKDRVFLSACRFYSEGKRMYKPSPFIGEAVGESIMKKIIVGEEDKKKQLSLFDYKKRQDVTSPKTPTNSMATFSFSQLQTYKTCPLQYKYAYVLKIPTAPGPAASFGDTIHHTLQAFYTEYIKDKSVGKNRLMALYETNWIPVGYTSKKYAERMKKEGKRMLTEFFDTFHTTHLTVRSIEQFFKIKIEGDSFLTGKIDRVDTHKNGDIEIIDYKTGKKPSEKDLQKSLQLSLYALAATDKGLYQKKLHEVRLTFYFLQTMEKVTLKRTPEEIEAMKTEVRETIHDIRHSNFPPKVGPWCDFCPFRMICEAWQ